MSVPPFDLTGKHAVVTGGGSGIGLAICRVFAARGCRLTVLDVDEKRTTATLQREGIGAAARGCNVAEYTEVERVINSITDPINILINNAGIAHIGTLESTDPEELDRVYAVNVRGVFNCSKAVVPALRANGGGVILNIGSVAGLVGLADRIAYSTTKGAVHTLTLATAKDHLADGIRCNFIAPARIHTPFVDAFLAKNYPGREEEMFANLSATQPIGRMGRPEEVAHLALYLCSDEASFITGSCFPIDGGFTTLNT